jgi:transcriptional regulator with XRE-family HTH domain
MNEKEQFLQKVGARLKKLRKEKGYSNHEVFANDLDMTRSQYWAYENGSKNITVCNLKKVLDGLNVSLEEFFSEGF